MRNIENLMIESIKARKRFSSGNTQVVETENGVNVLLHGNKICEVGADTVKILDGGWTSKVTKSRLNVLLDELVPGRWGVVQKKGQWYIVQNGEVNAAWENNATFKNGELVSVS